MNITIAWANSGWDIDLRFVCPLLLAADLDRLGEADPTEWRRREKTINGAGHALAFFFAPSAENVFMPDGEKCVHRSCPIQKGKELVRGTEKRCARESGLSGKITGDSHESHYRSTAGSFSGL